MLYVLGVVKFRPSPIWGSCAHIKWYNVAITICNIDLIVKMYHNKTETKAINWDGSDSCYIHSIFHFRLLLCLREVILTYFH